MDKDLSYTITLDDDPTFCKIIERATGIKTLSFKSGGALLRRCASYRPIAVFVDIHLDIDDCGLDVIAHLRIAWPFTPIIVVTGDTKDFLVSNALASGANDFIRKPINTNELNGRLRARIQEMDARKAADLIDVGDVKFSKSKLSIERKEKVFYLPKLEAELFVILSQNRGMTLTRDEIRKRLWGRVSVSDNTIDKKISGLRRTLLEIGSELVINTIYGKGVALTSKGPIERDNEIAPIENGLNTDYGDALKKPLVDRDAIEKIYAFDRPGDARGAFLTELLRDFREIAPGVIESIGRAVLKEDQKKCEHLSHKLKGMSQNFSASRMSALCGHMEELCRSGKRLPSGIVDEINKSYMLSLKAIEGILSEESTSSSFINFNRIEAPSMGARTKSIKSTKILLVEDCLADADLLQGALAEPSEDKEFEITHVQDLSEAFQKCKENCFDLVFLDLGLPDSFGLHTFMALHAAIPETPIVVLSGSSDDYLASQTIVRGSQDYISKNQMNRPVLLKTILYALARWELTKKESQQLIEESRRMQKLSRLKSEFLANMSHEIRTPMNGVIGMTSLLASTDLSEEQREYLSGIQTAGDSLLEIINDILDYSKIEAGKVEIERINFNLRELIDDVLLLFFEPAMKKGLYLTSCVDPKVPSLICGDPTRIKQILINLIGNSIKFTLSGSVAVRVQAYQSAANRTIQFSVSDTGVGIKPEYMESLFQPFTQEDSSTTRKFGGTGLGLTICKNLAQLMGGEISVESEVGKGSSIGFSVSSPVEDKEIWDERINLTEFTAKLVIRNSDLRDSMYEYLSLRGLDVVISEKPSASWDILVTDDELVAEKLSESSDQSSFPVLLLAPRDRIQTLSKHDVLRAPYRQSELYRRIARLLGDKSFEDMQARRPDKDAFVAPNLAKRILVVEDNVMNQKVAARMLEKLGVSHDIASNGIEALKAIENNAPYDLVLMDCSMPEMDGFEATRKIRALPSSHSKIPIIAMTANAFAEDREKCISSGMNHYLSKPMRIEDLKSLLMSELKSS